MRNFYRHVVLLVMIVCFVTSAFAEQTMVEAVAQIRSKDKRLTQTILGALAFLEDRQVRPRTGKRSCEFDSSDEGDGSRTLLSFNLPFFENIGIPAGKKLKARNRTGEWASFIHFMPNKIGVKGRAPAAVQDSSLFMTAFNAYPLFLFDESRLPPQKQHINYMLRLAMTNIQSFKRDDGYNFWAVLPGFRGETPRTGPFNIEVPMLETLAKAYLNPRFDKLFAALARGQQTPPKYWLEACLDLKNNPTGADALFNIPNDADDTSVAVAFQHIFARRFPDSGINADLQALDIISRYRDLGREKEDGRDSWKGKNTGAYLTWMKDEAAPTFSNPEKGIIPLGVNNVDVVVNANVLFAMALTNQKHLPGYLECARLVRDSAKKRTWPEAGLYYPQKMIFPYSASRAYRDGMAREPEVKEAMQYLLVDLLKMQKEWAVKNPTRRGAFPGGDDKSDHLSTALAVTTLINIGRRNAEEMGLEIAYDRAVNDGIRYLLGQCIWKSPKNPETRGKFKTPDGKCATWMSGLFFAASFWDLAHWRSQAFTVSVALEALTKYALAYDQDDAPAGVRKIRLNP